MIKLEMTKKQEVVLGAIVLVIAIAAFLVYMWAVRTPVSESAGESVSEPALIEIINDFMEKCDKVEDAFLQQLESGVFYPQNPLVIVNPYGTAPLTALVLFKTYDPARISVHVTGKTEDADVIHSYEEFNTDHIIPVYGLYPDMTNIVQLTVHYADASYPMTLMIETGRISVDLPDNLILSKKYTPDGQNSFRQSGFYFTHGTMSAFDMNGDYRWYYDGFNATDLTLYTEDGNFYLVTGLFAEGNATLLVINMLGRVLQALPIEPGYPRNGYNQGYIELREFYTGE